MTPRKPRPNNSGPIPDYRSLSWKPKGLPLKAEPWQVGKRQSVGKDRSNHHAFLAEGILLVCVVWMMTFLSLKMCCR